MIHALSHKSPRPNPTSFIVLALLANGLLLTPAGSLPRVCGALALLLLPGIAWSSHLLSRTDLLARWTVGAGLSYALMMVLGLILQYLPGSVPLWSELIVLNGLILIPSLATRSRDPQRAEGIPYWLVAILVVAALFRISNLGYSEFQGDEALAMIAAAEALEGHQDALFLRGKGPGEVLLPMSLWSLTGTINEMTARLPFTLAGLLLVLTTYLLGRRLLPGGDDHLGRQAGLIAAGLLALNGFMVAFSRIVQYQVLVLWMGGLALLCAWESRSNKNPFSLAWPALTGAFLGAGLLAHYDAILVAPAVAYVLLSPAKAQPEHPQPSKLRTPVPKLLVATGCFFLVAGLFYFPYALDPQAARTGDYLGDRIGGALFKNNLGSFLHFSFFYNSSSYVILTGLLAAGFLAWALQRAPGVQRVPGGRYWIPVLTLLCVLGLMLWPSALSFTNVDMAILPFALILAFSFLSTALDTGQRAVVAWLAVPFLGYNFAVALPLTHIYTTVPAWTLLAGLATAKLLKVETLPYVTRYSLLAMCYLLPVALFSGYLYTAYLRHDVEFWQDWPESQPSLYWSPYHELPPAGFFGFAHRTGWKQAGTLYAMSLLSGDYGSNEEPEVTTWYTRGAPRACDARPEYYLLADDLVDPWPVDLDAIQANYAPVGRITLPNNKGLSLYQAQPTTADLGQLRDDGLKRDFDRTATSAAFARSARGSQSADANLGDLVRLVGYDVDTRRARPGGRVAVTLYWQAQAPITEDYHVFVHLEGDEETGNAPGIWGQADGRPVCWTYPTYDWRPGQIIADHHALTVKPNTPTGGYSVLVGMYLPESGTRLDILDEAGAPISNSLKLTTVPVR